MDKFPFDNIPTYESSLPKDNTNAIVGITTGLIFANAIFSAERKQKERWVKEAEEQERMMTEMSEENLRKVREISRDVENNLRGVLCEEKIHSYLNPGPFAAVPHYELQNVYLVDDKGMSHEIDFIEIRETGVFCIEAKNWSGTIRGTREDPQWFVNGEPRKNPTRQNDTHIRALHDVIGKKPHITSMVVFGQNNCRNLHIPGVICLSDFRSFMNQFTEKVISPERMKEIYHQISSARVAMTRKEHVQNIKLKAK